MRWGDSMSMLIAVVGGILLLILMILVVYVLVSDAEMGEVASFVTSITIGLVVGFAAMSAAIVGEFAGLIAELPGWSVALAASILGALSLEGALEFGPQMFIVAVLVVAVIAIAIREG